MYWSPALPMGTAWEEGEGREGGELDTGVRGR